MACDVDMRGPALDQKLRKMVSYSVSRNGPGRRLWGERYIYLSSPTVSRRARLKEILLVVSGEW
jgi:hypothetical protein